ncbi:COG2944 Predicted transcriptional regulator [uncultured Caudovirales phage]|uniref:COG2944 Predicted transcriptional regulator n=1 Tax=uncultured Caudovirales phage TaxID=2100421 RepID=A0A6J7WF55_9CAUD|nr:COG2944 Predicted transcriptional regulator [uncultured Caudovirales phage]
MSYHYVDSGLDNVYLENGYTIHQTPYGEGVSIHDTDGLHRMLADWLIDLPRPLNGAELRFLRIQMDMTQRSLSAVMGEDEQALRRWEKARSKPIRGAADRLVRALYNEYVGGDGTLRSMVERLAELDQVEVAAIHLREDQNHWQIAA